MSGRAQILALFREVLRVHRRTLPEPMRGIGDEYVKNEFHSLRKANATAEQWRQFGEQWRKYADMLQSEEEEKTDAFGDVRFEDLNAEQREQFRKLQTEISGMYDGDEGEGEGGKVPGPGAGAPS